MTLDQLKSLLKKGKYYNWGLIPNWIGYVKYDFYLDEVYFVNKDYKLNEQQLRDKIKDRTDLLYII